MEVLIGAWENKMLLNQFEEKGLAIASPISGGRLRIDLKMDAFDFIKRGGFRFEEDAFQYNFTKLENEVAKLEREHPAINFESITKAIGALAAVSGIVASFKK